MPSSHTSHTPTSDELCQEYMPLAKSLARSACRRYNQSYADVLSDAMLGLVGAAKRCDPDRPLGPYAQRCISGSILHGVRDRFGQRGAYERGAPYVTVLPLDGDVRRSEAKSLDEQHPDALSTPDHADAVIDSITLWDAVMQLAPTQRRYIIMYHYCDLSQVQIARRLDCTQMTVSRGLRHAYALLEGFMKDTT